jgi:DNA-binding LytR/AlgR family response regulator
MRVLIIDDEPLARESLTRMLAAYSDVEIAGEAANGLDAVESILRLEPDAVFLDIEMPGLDGFEVLSAVAKPPAVVFATAYDEYAIRAFEANAVDYLLKPIQPERVSKCVDRLREALGHDSPLSGETLRKLLAELRPAGPRRIAVRQANRIVLVAPKEIVHVSAEDKLVFVHTAKGKFLVEKTVTEMEECLEQIGFFRISRADIVNMDCVRELMPWFSGAWRVKLTTGEELDVSRERAKGLKKLLGL